MPQQYKIDKVAEIESRIAENAGLFVVNYNGLTVKQAQDSLNIISGNGLAVGDTALDLKDALGLSGEVLKGLSGLDRLGLVEHISDGAGEDLVELGLILARKEFEEV